MDVEAGAAVTAGESVVAEDEVEAGVEVIAEEEEEEMADADLGIFLLLFRLSPVPACPCPPLGLTLASSCLFPRLGSPSTAEGSSFFEMRVKLFAEDAWRTFRSDFPVSSVVADLPSLGAGVEIVEGNG